MEHSSEMPGFVLSFWKERAGGFGGWASLQDLALGSLLSAGAQESGTGSGLEHFAVRAEHSRYLYAPIFLRTSSPCCGVKQLLAGGLTWL
jgi:hypothetical protein